MKNSVNKEDWTLYLSEEAFFDEEYSKTKEDERTISQNAEVQKNFDFKNSKKIIVGIEGIIVKKKTIPFNIKKFQYLQLQK